MWKLAEGSNSGVACHGEEMSQIENQIEEDSDNGVAYDGAEMNDGDEMSGDKSSYRSQIIEAR